MRCAGALGAIVEAGVQRAGLAVRNQSGEIAGAAALDLGKVVCTIKSALGMQRQEDHNFKAALDYTANRQKSPIEISKKKKI